MLKCITLILFSSLCYAQHEKIIEKAIYPKVAHAIYVHESNRGKSVLARKHNNVYGFKGGTRKIGKTSGKYSIYRKKEDSVLDYLDYERKLVEKYDLRTRDEYLYFLSRRYASDKKWINKIRKNI